MSGGATPGQIRAAIRHCQPPGRFIYPGRARARACAALNARPCVQEVACRDGLFADMVPDQVPGSPIIQRLGCPASRPFRRDSRLLPRQCAGSSSLFPHCRYVRVCDASRRLSRAGSPGCAGRRSVVAGGGMPHPAPPAARSAAAVVTRRLRRWLEGGAEAVLGERGERAVQTGRRVRGSPVGGGMITSVASCPGSVTVSPMGRPGQMRVRGGSEQV